MGPGASVASPCPAKKIWASHLHGGGQDRGPQCGHQQSPLGACYTAGTGLGAVQEPDHVTDIVRLPILKVRTLRYKHRIEEVVKGGTLPAVAWTQGVARQPQLGPSMELSAHQGAHSPDLAFRQHTWSKETLGAGAGTR